MNKDSSIKERYNFIIKRATRLINAYDTKNPFVLAKVRGLEISICDLNTPGFITGNTIYINKRLDTYSRKIICAHELGHSLFHKKSDIELFDSTDNVRTEFEANLFVLLTMPQIFARADKDILNSMSKFNDYVTRQISYIY